MSTDTSFPPEPPFPQATSRGGSKRKRGPAGSPTATRTSPTTRRNQYMAQSTEDASMAPTTSMEEHNNHDFLQGNGLTNLPNLAPNPAAGNHDTDTSSIDTATRALNFTMQVPQHPHDTFMAEQAAAQGDQSTFNNTEQAVASALDQTGDDAGEGEGDASDKPTVGSDEWQRQRKDNHKEVERRRRETINEGINELAKVVPNCEKNKGSILASTVSYIAKLHGEASQNIDKWTFEKLVTEQAINDLSGKLRRAWEEKEAWKRVAGEHGVDLDNVDLQLDDDDEEDDKDENKSEDKRKDSKAEDVEGEGVEDTEEERAHEREIIQQQDDERALYDDE